MNLPSKDSCSFDPLLKSFWDADFEGFLSPNSGKNKYFLNRQRVLSAVESLLKKLPPPDSSSVLVADIACGTGNAGLFFVKNGYNVEFVDNEEKFFDYIQLKHPQEKLQFHKSDVNNLELVEKYDGVFFGEAIEHMAHPLETFKTLHRCLKRGGYLVLTTPNGSFKNCNEPCWEEVKNDHERNSKLANTIGNHVCEFKPSELKSLAKEAGFIVEEHFLVNSDTVSRRSALRRILPFNLMRSLDKKWAKKKVDGSKDEGRIQILLAQRAH